MKNIIKNNGITLVALVITIILLLILAGITISQLAGNGIFEKVKEAKEKYEIARQKEENLLFKTELLIGNRDEIVPDYTDNLLYRLNLDNLSSQQGITITGTGVTVSNDKKVVTFDGNSCLTVNNNTIDPTSTARTIVNKTLCCWFKTNIIHTSDAILLGYGEDGVDGIYNKSFVGLDGNNMINTTQGYATISRKLDQSNISNNQWHFIASVWSNNNTFEIYYDGVPFRATGSYAQTNSYLDIAGDHKSNRFFKGSMADIRIYTEALTENNIKQLFEYGKQYLEIK